MTRLSCRRLLRAAGFTAGIGLGLLGAGDALAQTPTITVPQTRQLDAAEAMASPGVNGVDHSANAPALTGLTLLTTIVAPTAPRLGYVIQAQCTAGLTVVLDDQAGAFTMTEIVLAGASANGGAGGMLTMAGMPHTGRIRIYSSASGCQMAARAW